MLINYATDTTMHSQQNLDAFPQSRRRHGDESHYINKNFKLSKRPFPVKEIYLSADYTGKGSLLLAFRTHFGEALINDVMDGIKWGPQSFTASYNDRKYWHFDLQQHHTADQIKHLSIRIFECLTQLTFDTAIIDKLQTIQMQIETMLDEYCMNYPKDFPPPADFLISDLQNGNIPGLYNDTEGRELHEAIFHADIDKVHCLLRNGTNPNAYYYGRTNLCNLDVDVWMKIRHDENKRWTILNIINLLIEYHANPMLETAWENTAFEIVLRSAYFAQNTPAEFYEEVIKRMVASPYFYPHIQTTRNPKAQTMDMVIHGSNMFYQAPVRTMNGSNKITHLAKLNDYLIFHTLDNKFILVKICQVKNLSDKDKQELFQLFKSNFDCKNFKTEAALYQYFHNEFLTNPETVIDKIYANDQLSGFNVTDMLLDLGHDTNIVHHVKLAVANAEFSKNYKGFLSMLAFARGFGLKVKWPEIPVITYLEAASIYSFTLVKDIAYPHVQTNQLETSVHRLARKLYPENKLQFINEKLYIKDDLSAASLFPAPHGFWNRQTLTSQVYEKRYQRDKHSLVMGFFNTKQNFAKLQKRIDPHKDGVRFMDIVTEFSKDSSNQPVSTYNARL